MHVAQPLQGSGSYQILISLVDSKLAGPPKLCKGPPKFSIRGPLKTPKFENLDTSLINLFYFIMFTAGVNSFVLIFRCLYQGLQFCPLELLLATGVNSFVWINIKQVCDKHQNMGILMFITRRISFVCLL